MSEGTDVRKRDFFGQLGSFIAQVGFPVVVSLLLLLNLGSKMDKLSEKIEGLIKVIEIRR